MLGSQTWIAVVGVPSFIIAGFIASRKRLAYQWKEELMDFESEAYPSLTDEHMRFLSGISPDSLVSEAETSANPKGVDGAFGIPLSREENIGLRVESEFLAPHEANVFLNQVRLWSEKFGCGLDPRKVNFFETQMDQVRISERGDSHTGDSKPKAGMSGCLQSSWAWLRRRKSENVVRALSEELDSSFFSQIRVISDHPESNQPVKAPWGSGDHMRFDLMPASLRNIVHRVQNACPGIGRLRHVYIEYSPKGSFYHEPTSPKHYDGHDYVIIPLRQNTAQMVMTFSPLMRSRFSSLRDVMRMTWTNRDLDCLLPHGSLLRVCGVARYEWGWSVRPGAVWFGSRLNKVPPTTPPTITSSSPGMILTFLKSLHRVVRSPSLILSAFGESYSDYQQSISRCIKGVQRQDSDAALIVLHFEGPRSKKKQRSMFMEPEIFIFGKAPTVDTFETWSDNQPTEESVRKVGVFRFMLRNYFNMLDF
ncbi:unnamed protein product [Phytomonas sp. Hart1]|nr:unnamed protein product [Phytomonas sp. Hart1]|eukprot:CCW69479.1 unnamed protein product [Phytomonas sp. isolate Hart1]